MLTCLNAASLNATNHALMHWESEVTEVPTGIVGKKGSAMEIGQIILIKLV
jgi:hypothetical protein